MCSGRFMFPVARTVRELKSVRKPLKNCCNQRCTGNRRLPKSVSSGPVIKVVTSAIMTSIVKMRGDRMPKSYAMFRAMSSIRPRVLIRAPS